MADKNGNGSLDVDELQSLLSKSMVLRSALDAMDTDGDSSVSSNEWLSYVKSQADKNASATKKLLRAYAKHLGADKDFDQVKEGEERKRMERIEAEGEAELRKQREIQREEERAYMNS